jgi:quinol monooxygenase YgiN
VITFVARMTVRPENAAAYEELMAYVRDQTRAHEPDVVYYDFGKGVDEPDTYVVVEVYRDAAAQAAHMQTEWVRGSLPEALRLMDGRPDIKQYVSGGSEPVTAREFR